ncbi:MAG TPA: hypothetical protein VF927_09610 [Solirubrobacteraceae bacterium]
MNASSSPSRRLRGKGTAATAGLIAAIVLSAPAQAGRRTDHAPPGFAGLASATTCVPGPVGGGISTSYHLAWEAATDNVTRSRKIVYEIYQSKQPGGEDYSHPTYTTGRGVTTFETPKLPSAETFYFVVRARDWAGNEDSNTVEREGLNLCV